MSNKKKLIPLVTSEEDKVLKQFYMENPLNKNIKKNNLFREISLKNHNELNQEKENPFDETEAWIQTYTGIRFTPLKPNYNSIYIEDIAHALSMQCRFAGHIHSFYSVAQHSVLVSYLCNNEDALYGLLHDATEAYLVDIPSPLKRSEQFKSYRHCEKIMQDAICKKFNLPMQEPPSVKKADKLMLATEARDLFLSLRKDWNYPVNPLPMKIEPISPAEAEKLFLNRFNELKGL